MSKTRHTFSPHQTIHLATLTPTAEDYARNAIEWLHNMRLTKCKS